MVGSFITRGIIMVLGYLYPAYECFKCLERVRPDLEHLRFWCQYWVIIALVTVLERLGDALISWVPMYSEAKLAFIIYLWYPKTRGTTYVYTTFLRPFVAQHEHEIDRTLNELSTRAGDIFFLYWQQGSTYFQSRFMELLHYLASQSPRNRQVPPAARSVYPPPSAPGPGPVPTAGLNNRRPTPQPQPPPPPPGQYPGPYPGGPGTARSRPVLVEEDDDFDMVDSSSIEPSVPPYFPDEPLGPIGYMTRSRLRTPNTRA